MTSPQSVKTRWLPLGKAARRLGVHPTTLRRWAERGEFPVMVTPGGHRRFSESDVDRFATRGGRQDVPAISHHWIPGLVNGLPRFLENRILTLRTRFQGTESNKLTDVALALLSDSCTAIEHDTPIDEVRTAALATSRDLARVAFLRLGIAAAMEATLAVKHAALATAAALPELASMSADLRDRMELYFTASAEGVQLALCQAAEHGGANGEFPVPDSSNH